MKKKLLLVVEFFAVCAVAGGLIAAAGIDPSNGVTVKDAVSAIAAGALGALYIGVRLTIPFLAVTLADAKDALLKQITSSDPTPPPAA